VPIVASAPGEWIGKINHLRIDNTVTDVAITTRNDAVARLARGLDVSPERLLGMGDTNHWSAWSISDSDVQLHIAPVMETVCQAIYDSILRPMLVAEGIDPDRFVLWFDTSRLTADPDKSDEAKSAFDVGAITPDALLKHLGLGSEDGYDFESADGLRVWAQDKVSRDPNLLPVLGSLLGGQVPAVEAPPAAPTSPPPPDSAPTDSGSGASRQQPPNTESQTPGPAASVVAAVTDMWVVRALELAGKRRVNTRDRVQHERLRHIPAHRYHRVMGAVAPGEVGRLVRGWDATFDEQVLAGIGVDPEVLRDSVLSQVARELTTATVDGEVV